MNDIKDVTVGQMHELVDHIRECSQLGVAWKLRAEELEGELVTLGRNLTEKQAILDATLEINRNLEAELADAEVIQEYAIKDVRFYHGTTGIAAWFAIFGWVGLATVIAIWMAS